jgi:hypothetical protein
MSVTIDKFHVSQKFSKSAATELANCLNSDIDNDWTYKVDSMFNPSNGNEVFMVAVYDEDGEFVEYL